MPEIWLSYGPTDVVLDVKAENLERMIGLGGNTLGDQQILSKLETLDMSRPIELVIMEYSKEIHKIISLISELCSHRSLQKPKILVDSSNLSFAKNAFSDPTMSISEFNSSQISNS